MKRFLSGVLAALMLCGVLAGCGETNEAVEKGKRAVEVAEDFVDGNMDAATACAALDTLYSEVHSIGLSYDAEDDGSIDSFDKRSKATDIEIAIMSLKAEISGTTNKYSSKSIITVEEKIDGLKEALK